VDTTGADFAIGVISTKTDPGVYNPPVVPNKVNQVYDKESSLALRYAGLQEGTQLRILKRFTGQGTDLTLYRDLNFWVHTDSMRDGAEYYFRMGSNDKNYYEIQVPFTKTFYNNTGWARVSVRLADLTNLKFETPDSVVTGTAVDLADASHVYPVLMRGIPNLKGVRFLYAGVRNRSNPAPQTGEIWMDDIFTGNVMRDFDHSERVTANLSVAGGAIAIGGNWARTGADYRGLRQTRGAGADQTNYGINARTDLQYFLPLAGFSIPISGNYTHLKSLPKFPPNSDTEIKDPAVIDSLRTERVGRGFSTSLLRRTQSKNFLMRYTMDRIKPTFAYSDQRGISPAVRDTSTSMTGGLAYQVNWAGRMTVPLFGKNRLRWWPNSFDFSSTATRQKTHRWSLRNGEFRQDPVQYRATLISQGSVRYNPFQSLETSYGMTINRDVSLPHEWLGVNIGQETARGSNARVAFIPPDWPVFRLFDPSIEVQSGYNEDSSPNVRREEDPDGTRNVSASRNTTGRVRFDFSRHVKTIFKWIGWDPTGGETGRVPPPPPPPEGDDTGAGTTATAEPDSTPKPRPGLGTLFGGVGRILTRIQPISGNVQHRLSSSYNRITERPSYAYRLGWTTDTGLLDAEGNPVSSPDQQRENLTYNFNSSVRLKESSRGAQTVDLQARFAHNQATNSFRDSRTRTVTETWPDLQLKWDNLQEFKPLKPILASGQLTVDYRQNRTESGPADQPPISISEALTVAPGLQFMWKNELNSTLGVSYGRNSSETRGATAQVSGSKSTTTNFSVNLDLRKNFRAGGGLMLFGKGLKWNNELETTLIIAYTKNGGERFAQGSTVAQPIPSATSIRVGPTARYYFSKNVSGSAFVDYSRTYAEATDVTTTTVRVGITALINF